MTQTNHKKEEVQKYGTSFTLTVSPNTSCRRLDFSLFNKPALQLARSLLGQTLVRVLDTGQRLSGRIVETEAYLGVEDGACHCYNWKKTKRTEAMFMPPGTAYVYHIYFRYFCFNISSQGAGSVVLLRAIQPIDGMDSMRQLRGKQREDQGLNLEEHQLCCGPSKICMAFDIDSGRLNKESLVTSSKMWLEEAAAVQDQSVVVSTRVGFQKAPEEWRLKPWRFYELGNRSVSVRDKVVEAKL